MMGRYKEAQEEISKVLGEIDNDEQKAAQLDNLIGFTQQQSPKVLKEMLC